MKFYKTGVDITSTKSMFNFLNEHFTYYTMNSWNGNKSIANNVKLYNLGLDGDYWTAHAFLNRENYMSVNDMIEDWEAEHPGYEVGFNGSSGGYLVLYKRHSTQHVLDDNLIGYDSYEDWKADIKDYGYTVRDFYYELREYVNLIRDFDKLCDEIRDWVNVLSTSDFTQIVLEEEVDSFNDEYYTDLEQLGIKDLEVNKEGEVDVTDIKKFKCLYQAFYERLAAQKEYGCKVEESTVGDRNYIKLVA